MKLSELRIGQKAVISRVRGRGAFRKRIMEMGFVPGKEIQPIKKAPLNDPIEYRIMGYDISLRNSEAELIDVIEANDDHSVDKITYEGVIDSKTIKTNGKNKEKEITVALVGNPNSGKTTIFNYASGLRERVGNYGGVTIDAKFGKVKINDYVIELVDLPGTYSITAYSPEELFVRDFITKNTPDIVVNIIDASNLERNLYLTTQLIDMDIKVIVALNIYDELLEKGDKFDYKKFGELLGIPFVPTVASKGTGISELLNKIIEVYEDKDETVRHIHINYGLDLENYIKELQDLIYKSGDVEITTNYSSRFLAIKLLEKDSDILELIKKLKNYDEIKLKLDKIIKKLESDHKTDTESLITDARYGFIAGALKESYKQNKQVKVTKTELIDKIITHRFWGIPIFLFFMWFTFFMTFTIGEYPMKWIEAGVNYLGMLISTYLSDGIFKDFLIQGILGGSGSVLAFLPNIVLLYFFISIMEDTGYMARAVFIMDKAMHKIGLHGKSFIPLLMGFGCNVPAIMSSRIIESKKDRLITMLINPFMSCSARLTVFILFISAFFDSYQSIILFSLYLLGVTLALLSALLFRKTLFKKEDIPFVMELPPYRLPTFKSILKHMWYRAKQYLKKVGGVILIASVIIWFLGYFPREANYSRDYDDLISTTKANYQLLIDEAKNDKAKQNQISAEMNQVIKNLELEKEAERQEQSFIGRIGLFILPVMEPLGFDWKMSIGLLSGLSAKEVVVGTLGVLYQAGEDDEQQLINKLRQQTYTSGDKKGQLVFNPLVAFSYLIFILIYFPCVGVISAIKRESGGWKWAIFIAVYTTTLAWILSFIFYQVGSLITGL
ncbi:MAG: ferrous iron transport protein B [Candidatus Kapabacteria bacterium]|nr:ferrous iron transport protein B [Candidatus Kapabacteria bacterium]